MIKMTTDEQQRVEAAFKDLADYLEANDMYIDCDKLSPYEAIKFYGYWLAFSIDGHLNKAVRDYAVSLDLKGLTNYTIKQIDACFSRYPIGQAEQKSKELREHKNQIEHKGRKRL